MTFGVSSFTLPKRGSSSSENRDAIWPRLFPPWKAEPQERRAEFQTDGIAVGVADGATEGILSGVWAHVLLKASSKSQSPAHLPSAIKTARHWWNRFKKLRSQAFKSPLTNLPAWLEEQALARGAFATICSATFSSDYTWTGFAVGDSCMFQIRGNELVSSWPLADPDEFNNSPYLVSSEPQYNEDLDTHVIPGGGFWQPADKFYFATDALACWFLRQHQLGCIPWKLLQSFDAEGDPQAFGNFIEAARDSGEMRNDDVSLIRLEFLPTEAELAHVPASASGI